MPVMLFQAPGHPPILGILVGVTGQGDGPGLDPPQLGWHGALGVRIAAALMMKASTVLAGIEFIYLPIFAFPLPGKDGHWVAGMASCLSLPSSGACRPALSEDDSAGSPGNWGSGL
jgi:hypothetical protein